MLAHRLDHVALIGKILLQRPHRRDYWIISDYINNRIDEKQNLSINARDAVGRVCQVNLSQSRVRGRFLSCSSRHALVISACKLVFHRGYIPDVTGRLLVMTIKYQLFGQVEISHSDSAEITVSFLRF